MKYELTSLKQIHKKQLPTRYKMKKMLPIVEGIMNELLIEVESIGNN